MSKLSCLQDRSADKSSHYKTNWESALKMRPENCSEIVTALSLVQQQAAEKWLKKLREEENSIVSLYWLIDLSSPAHITGQGESANSKSEKFIVTLEALITDTQQFRRYLNLDFGGMCFNRLSSSESGMIWSEYTAMLVGMNLNAVMHWGKY